jgi:hypothetical protein
MSDQVGVTYIQYGKYISDFGSSSLYKEVLPFSSLAIVTGGLVFLYLILANMSLRGTNSSFLLTTASWNLCWLMTGLSFAVTVIAALVFAKFTVIIRDNGISFSDLRRSNMTKLIKWLLFTGVPWQTAQWAFCWACPRGSR